MDGCLCASADYGSWTMGEDEAKIVPTAQRAYTRGLLLSVRTGRDGRKDGRRKREGPPRPGPPWQASLAGGHDSTVHGQLD